MELHKIRYDDMDIIVLLNEDMRLVKPVYNYLKHLIQKGRAFNTIKANGNDLKLYWEFLKEKNYEYDKITFNNINEFIKFLTKGKRTEETINRILSTIYNFYRYCCDDQEINNLTIVNDISFITFKDMINYTKCEKEMDKSSKTTFKLVSDNDFKTFLNALPTWRDKLIFKILYLTGARIGEVLELKIEDIYSANTSIEVCILKNIKSKGSRRDLYIPKTLLQEIKNFIVEERNKIKTEHNYVFISQQKQNLGKPLTYRGVYEVFNVVRKKTNINLNFHDLRHTFATTLVESDINTNIVKSILGHKYITTTNEYTHISNEYIEDSLKKHWNKNF